MRSFDPSSKTTMQLAVVGRKDKQRSGVRPDYLLHGDTFDSPPPPCDVLERQRRNTIFDRKGLQHRKPQFPVRSYQSDHGGIGINFRFLVTSQRGAQCREEDKAASHPSPIRSGCVVDANELQRDEPPTVAEIRLNTESLPREP